MRLPLLPQDVTTTARVLLAESSAGRAYALRRIERGAQRAALFAKVTGRCHPRWGDGSLDAAARGYFSGRHGPAAHLPNEPFWSDANYAGCLRLVLSLRDPLEQCRRTDLERA